MKLSPKFGYLVPGILLDIKDFFDKNITIPRFNDYTEMKLKFKNTINRTFNGFRSVHQFQSLGCIKENEPLVVNPKKRQLNRYKSNGELRLNKKIRSAVRTDSDKLEGEIIILDPVLKKKAIKNVCFVCLQNTL